MVLSSGFYRNGRFHLTQDLNADGLVLLTENAIAENSKLRKDKDGWLSIDDGLVGRYGTPDHLRVLINDTKYRIWVEQRGRDQFGLIPTDETGTYSNKFIGISSSGEFTIEEEWTPENGAIWVVSTKLDGQPGV